MGKKSKRKPFKPNAVSEAWKSVSEEGMRESFSQMDMMDSMSLADQKKLIRNKLIEMGTDCKKNDKDPYGNGDQHIIKNRKLRDSARELYSIGGDIHAHLTNMESESVVAPLWKLCVVGEPLSVKKMIHDCKSEEIVPSRNLDLIHLLERRETSMRLSPLLGIVSAGKNLMVPNGMANHEETAKILLQNGANPYAQDVLGKTVVHYGAGGMGTKMTLNVVEMCIEAAKSHHMFGFEVELFGLKAETWNGKRGIVGGFDPDTGRRSVFIDGKPVKTKLENLRLIDDSIKPLTPLTDVRDRMGQVSLLEVIMQNRDDVAEFLLEKHNTDIHTKDADGISAFSMCQGMGRFQSSVAQMVMDAASKRGSRKAKAKKKEAHTKCAFCKNELGETGGAKCAACKKARYCNRECQVAHWKNGHRNECQLANSGVKLDKPKNNGMYSARVSLQSGGTTKPSNNAAQGYKKPRGIKANEKFFIKLQCCNDSQPIMVYDESRYCEFFIDPGTSGFKEIVREIRKENSWSGMKTFMKASFDENGDCTVYPASATPRFKW
jgi:hypothetical protein